MILPRPLQLTPMPGRFVIPAALNLWYGPGAERAGELLAGYLGRHRTNLGPAVRLAVVPGLDSQEYALEIRESEVTLTASCEAGLLRGIQTLRLLDSGSGWPCASIRDRPRLGWRGVMLDVARHFMPIDFLFRFVDQLALHRLNVLHLHLTDDQGWRIEIDGLPRLTEVGAWRSESMIGPPSSGHFDATPHGGFYTRGQLRGLVAHARDRGVTIVPEIEMPGHARAAIAAYPHLGNRPDRELSVWTRWGICEDVLGVHDEALDFCRQVLTEVLDIFPSRYIHIGGDECPPTQWAASVVARQRARELGLTGVGELHAWFLGQMHDFLAGHGRVAVCWDETGESQGELPAGLVRMVWRDPEHGVRTVARGGQVIMAPRHPTYFDYLQYRPNDPSVEAPHINTLEDVLAYDPLPDGLPVAGLDEGRAGVLGTQAQLWSEHMPTPWHVLYQAYPRLCAFAEVAWTAEPVAEDFMACLEPHLIRLRQLGVRTDRTAWHSSEPAIQRVAPWP